VHDFDAGSDGAIGVRLERFRLEHHLGAAAAHALVSKLMAVGRLNQCSFGDAEACGLQPGEQARLVRKLANARVVPLRGDSANELRFPTELE
jgi:hypothetical protein